MTLTSAPVSMRNRRPEVASGRNNRRLVGRPGSLVAASDWPDHFPTSGRVAGISWYHLRIFGDTSRDGLDTSLVEGGWLATHVRVTNVGRL